jgi:hypothetical protein
VSKLTDQLETIGVFNASNLVEKGHPFVWRRSGDSPRCVAGGWMLSIKGKKFKSAHWTDYGAMWFSDTGFPNWRAAIAAPLAKCKELFPDLEMVKGPWPNTYVPRVDLDAAMAKLKEKK